MINLVLKDGEWWIEGTSITAKRKEDLEVFVDAFEDDLRDYLDSDTNYGFLFFICGYDGKSQSAVQEKWYERGVYVF